MLIALDFDGVVIDGIQECMLVAWNVLHDRPLNDFNQKTLENIPMPEVSSFQRLRNFVRHDGHFIISFTDTDMEMIDNDSFIDIYNSIKIKDKDFFREKFTQYRRQARKTYPEFWAALHRPLLDIFKLFNTNHDIYIVSGKDADSISFILNNYGLEITTERIFGGIENKNNVLLSLKEKSIVEKKEILFIDDNIQNVIDALENGIKSFWADWGYQTPEHKKISQKKGIKGLNAEGLLNLVKTPISRNFISDHLSEE